MILRPEHNGISSSCYWNPTCVYSSIPGKSISELKLACCNAGISCMCRCVLARIIPTPECIPVSSHSINRGWLLCNATFQDKLRCCVCCSLTVLIKNQPAPLRCPYIKCYITGNCYLCTISIIIDRFGACICRNCLRLCAFVIIRYISYGFTIGRNPSFKIVTVINGICHVDSIFAIILRGRELNRRCSKSDNWFIIWI